MWNKLGYVALTYYSPYRAVMLVVWTIFLTTFWFLADGTPSQDRPWGQILFVVMPSLYVSQFAFSVGKLEFARSQARLVPGYAQPQLIFLIGMFVAGCVLLPALFAHRAGMSITGALAIIALLQIACTIKASGWIAVAVLFAASSKWGSDLWLLLDAKYTLWHCLIIVAGGIATTKWLYDLTHKEENSEALLFIQSSQFDRTSHAARKQRNAIESIRERGLKAICSDWWHDRISHHRAASLIGRVQLLRYGGAALPAVALALAMATGFLLYLLTMEILFAEENQTIAENLVAFYGYFAGLFGMFVPAAVAATRVGERQARMGSELLWPMSKGTYIDSLFLSAAFDGAILWVALHAIASGLMANASEIKFTASFLAIYLLVNFAFQLLLLGAFLLLSLCESTVVRIVIMIPLVLFPFAVTFYWWDGRRHAGDAYFLFWGLIAALVGTFCIQAARKAWREVEVI